MAKDSHKKSMLKSIVWQMLGVIVLALVTYIFTRSYAQSSLITFLHHGIFLLVFYLHERIWLLTKWGSKWKYAIKTITYETILGNLILGTITYLITGDIKQMTAITLTYIGTRHIMYFFYEWMWEKRK